MNYRLGFLPLLLVVSPLSYGGEDSAPLLSGRPSAKAALLSDAKLADVLIPEPQGSQWSLSSGLSLRNIGRITMRSSPSAFTIPQLFGGNSSTLPPGITPAPGRTYDDGFVGPDSRTPGLGRTSDYAYTSTSQLQGNNLVYTATGGERREVLTSAMSQTSGWEDDRDWTAAPYLRATLHTESGSGWRTGLSLQFSHSNIDGGRRGHSTRTAREERNIYDVTATDTYDASGLILPAAPYTGAPDIAAPLLPADPANRTLSETLRSTDVATWQDSLSESVDLDLWSFSVGAEAHYQRTERFYTSLGAGFVFHFANWDAQRRNTLLQSVNGATAVAIASRSTHRSGTDVLLGIYFQATAGYQITKQLSVEASARFDWTEELVQSVGRSSFEVDLTGFSLGLGARYTFW